MKILQIMAGAAQGGAETAFVDMCLALHDAGEQVEVITRANETRVPPLERAGIIVHTAPFGAAIDVFTPWRIGRVISAFQPDIVQTWMARAAQKTPNWKTLGTPKRYLVVSRLGGYYKIKNFRSSDYFTTITPDISRHLVDGGILAGRIRHINNFAETESGAAPVDRATLNTPEGAPVLLTLARLHESKAIDVVIRALADLPGVYLWVAGDGPLMGELEKLAVDLGVSDRTRFLGWRTDRSALLQSADICVFASRVEPFGTVFAQAWAEKTPVIVSDADGPRQFCRDGEDCLMVPKNDAGAIVAAVEKILSNGGLRERMIENGYKRYINEFTRQKTVSEYVGYYLEILKRERMI